MSEEVCEHLKVEEEGTGVKAFPYSTAISHLADLSSGTQDKIWVRIIVQKWTQNLLGNILKNSICVLMCSCFLAPNSTMVVGEMLSKVLVLGSPSTAESDPIKPSLLDYMLNGQLDSV